MNSPRPVNPQASRTNSSTNAAGFIIVFLCAVFFAGLMFQGCKRKETKPTSQGIEAPAPENLRLPATNPPELSQAKVQDVVSNPANSNVIPKTVTEIPPPVPSPAPTKGDTKNYTVARGDTLFKIARTNHVTISAIIKANANIDPAKLKAGQKIQIPIATARAGSLGSGKNRNSTVPINVNVHVVKAGETLTRIATEYRTNVKAIQSANNLNSASIFVGQKLNVPPASPSSLSAGPTGTNSTVSTYNPAQINR